MGMRPARLWSWLAAMTRNGLGTNARIMITSDRRRPRVARARSSMSRCASCSNCLSLFTANLQVGNCLRGGVEDALDGGAIDTTAELADARCEAGESGLERDVGLVRRAR